MPTTDEFEQFPELSKLQSVFRAIAPSQQISVAFSGGLSSRFLAFAAKKLGLGVELYHILAPQMPEAETAYAIQAAQELGLPLKLIPATELNLEILANAGRARCYICKLHLFAGALEMVKTSGAPLPLCDGTNASDLFTFRPGLRALKDLGISSPLALADITKARIREIGAQLGFPNPQQFSHTCLMTRFPYGTMPTNEQLLDLAEAEDFVRKDAFGKTFNFRIRILGPNNAVLHVSGPTLQKDAQGRIPLESIEGFKRLTTVLKQKYPQTLANLRFEILDELSGWYDRPENLSF